MDKRMVGSARDGDFGNLLYELAEKCSECHEEAGFEDVVNKTVKKLLPHRCLVAALGRIDLDHLEIMMLLDVDYPKPALQAIRQISNIRERQALMHWLQAQQPLLLELPQSAWMMSELEREEVEKYQLGRIGAHGVLNMSSKEGSYFSFAGIPRSVSSDELKIKLQLVVPHLHQALLRIYRAKCSALQVGTSLTEVEQELLRWVAAGRTNLEIAALRGRSPLTIRNQLSVMFRKLGASNRAEAVRLAHGTPHRVSNDQ